MAPDRYAYAAAVPQRPAFKWNTRNVPWTDGIGNQPEYADSVLLRDTLQDELFDSKSNKSSKNNRGIVVLSNLYGRVRDFCKELDHKKGAGEDNVFLTVWTV